MNIVKSQISEFIERCEDIKNCKFIMATTKIKDLLKCIVNSQELYGLFNTVVTNFDYSAAKQRCFIESDNGIYSSCRLVLPDTVGERLAFIFCLLVEFDRNDINLNVFLQRFYPKDGSYYTSYHIFCDEVIGSLENIIKDIYSRELSLPEEEPQPIQIVNVSTESATAQPAAAKPADDMKALTMLIMSERASAISSNLGEEEKEGALMMLDGLLAAVKRGDAVQIKAIASGYNYFIMQTGFVSQSLSAFSEALGEYISKL